MIVLLDSRFVLIFLRHVMEEYFNFIMTLINAQNLYFRAMTIMKARLKGAQKGHSLLKKKSDALVIRFRRILKTIIEVTQVTCSYMPFFFLW